MARRIEEAWAERLSELCSAIRDGAREALARAHASGERSLVDRPVRQGAGDVTYAIDELVERTIELWFDAAAREQPLSLLTEDTGWRHRGPDGAGGARELAGFDHGGPRIALDPIDGTRNVMADLRSAWTVVSFAPPSCGAPRLSDVTLGIVSEIPDSRAARFRVFETHSPERCDFALRELDGGRLVRGGELRVDSDARVDRGYFSFFRYAPDQRPAIARVEAEFFERLRAREGADLRHVFDDQYISNAGQLALLALGTYRMIADLRGFVARRAGTRTITSKPYDVAGAIACARAAGCVVEGPLGTQLDFELDVTTPVDFVGFANRATAERVRPHLDDALKASI
jgi:fructose-1,6-bisphosphatase/inositol monophosphatase family enzyme